MKGQVMRKTNTPDETKKDKAVVGFPDDIPQTQPPEIQKLENIYGMFNTSSSIPTATPNVARDQIVFYSSGSTYRVYIYDVTNNVWRYATLT